MTQDGAVLGTPAYMPPEQAQGDAAAIDHRADIYSLGAILYEMMTLTPPVGREGDMVAILLRVAEGRIDPPEQRAPDRLKTGWVPPELSAIAMKALAHKPADRYQTVEALRRDVELYLEGRSVSAKRDSAWEMAKKFVKRNKGLSAGLGVAVLVLLCSLGFLFAAWRETRSAYAAFEHEQREKEKRTRAAIPAFLEAAQKAIGQRDFEAALAQASLALEYDPQNAPALLLKGQLLVARKRFGEAAGLLNRYVALRPDDATAAKLASLCVAPDTDAAEVQVSMGQVLVAQKQLPLSLEFFKASGQQLTVYRDQIAAAWGSSKKWDAAQASLNLDKDGKFALVVNAINFKIFRDKIVDLAPLRGIPLSSLSLQGLDLRNLDDLKGMPLTQVFLQKCNVLSDLSGLRDAPLASLRIDQCPLVRDLSPLRGSPLSELFIKECPLVHDLAPLAGMPLEVLSIKGIVQKPNVALHDLSPLRGLPIRHLEIVGAGVKDIEALRAMPLRTLDLSYNKGLSDLSPLGQMELTELNIAHTSVKDLSPLEGMPLSKLLAFGTYADLRPLQGMPLTVLSTSSSDLTPLKDLPLEHLQTAAGLRKFKGFDVLRSMETLRRITIYMVGSYEAPEFWKRFDAGEFE